MVQPWDLSGPKVDFFGALTGIGNTFERARAAAEKRGWEADAAELYGKRLDALAAPTSPTPSSAPAAPSMAGSSETPAATPLPTFASGTGPSGAYLDRLIGRESGGDTYAKNPNSSATGLGQFTTGTWEGLRRTRPELGLTPDGRTDPAQTKRALVAFTGDNAEVLKRGGHEINDGNLYVAHFLGSAGANRFLGGLKANPAAPAVAYVEPAAAQANRSIFYKPDGKMRTASEVYANLTKTFAGGGAAPSGGVQIASSDKGFVPQTPGAAEEDGPSASQFLIAQTRARGGQPTVLPPQAQPEAGAIVYQGDPRAQAPATPPAPRLTTISPEQRAQLRQQLANPVTREAAMATIDRLSQPEGFEVKEVGGRLYRIGKNSGAASLIPGVGENEERFSEGGVTYLRDKNTNRTRVLVPKADDRYTDLLTPDERGGAGITSDFKGPVQRGPDGKLYYPAKPNSEVNIGGPEKEYDKTTGKAQGEYYVSTQTGGRTAAGALNTIRVMERLIESPDFYSGTGGERMTALKRAATSLGIADAASAAPNELFAKLSGQLVLDKAGGSLGAQISDGDRKFISATTANLDNTPAGNKVILSLARRLAEREIEVSRMARQYAAKNNGRLDGGFDDHMAAYAEANPITADLPQPSARPAGQPARASLPQGVTPAQALSEARAAIAGGKNRDAIVGRLRQMGIDPSGL